MSTPAPGLQPLLHDLEPCVRAPTAVLGGRDGQIRPGGVQGVFTGDVRVLSLAVLTLDDREPETVLACPDGPGVTRFVALARHLGDPGADPTVRVERRREALPHGLVERIELVSTAAAPVRTRLRLEVAADLAPLDQVKAGRATGAAGPASTAAGTLTWADRGVRVSVTGGPAADEPAAADPAGGALVWDVTVRPGESVGLDWRVTVAVADPVVLAPDRPAPWRRPQVRADDPRLARLLERSLDDLETLRIATTRLPGEQVLAAGAPWFLTLFGRDSLWAARMLLPLGTGIAEGTLRTLATFQGTGDVPATGEQPGKILHELRGRPLTVDPRTILPPVYYGTIDATPLWVGLLHDAWRFGLDEAVVEELLPTAERALAWLADGADPDGDGFVEYLDTSGHGLANQGWKDSGDAVRFADGRRAAPPVALCEVQGYACEAALGGAALLDAFGRPGADRWREYAAGLAARFRRRFWVDGPLGRYPALALDGDKRRADALTSNIGHLLGTGLLDPAEEAQVARMLAGDGLSGGYGLRTLSADNGGFSPLSYHCGSVWAHDTAIVVARLCAAGFPDAARPLLDGLLAAAEAFDYRLPELFGGDARSRVPRPVPYPAACRPQAWAAAASVALLAALVGLDPDVPGGTVGLRPMPSPPVGALAVDGLVLAGRPVDVRTDRDGTLVGFTLPDGLRVRPI